MFQQQTKEVELNLASEKRKFYYKHMYFTEHKDKNAAVSHEQIEMCGLTVLNLSLFSHSFLL